MCSIASVRQVDPADELINGKKFNDVNELKQHLLDDKAMIARCVAEKLLIYGRGSSLSFADRIDVDHIVERAAKTRLRPALADSRDSSE